ncbi:MAG TPA: HAD family phosphatase [Lautropia sp.]|nr:HAD family phosphatase [Lautropia sp.]
MNLVLFDLDHTLIPFDSNTAWMNFLIGVGAADATATERNQAFARDYMAGNFDPHAYHRFTSGLLAPHPRKRLEQWRREFSAEFTARARTELVASLQLVAGHRAAGDLCCMVTTTNRFVAQVFADFFGIANLVGTEAATSDDTPDGRFTGEVVGDPCFGPFKVGHVERWLKATGRSREDFERTIFYSDSRNDLPLLNWADEAVAVNPDSVLRAEAQARGWRILELRNAPAG